MLKVGYGRMDITPSLGVEIPGYYNVRIGEGYRDPLYATAVAFDDGEGRAAVFSVDTIGMNQLYIDLIRPHIAKACGIPEKAIFIHCTHTHTGGYVCESEEIVESHSAYGDWLVERLTDAVLIALKDLAPATLSYTKGRVEDVAFVRRFRMKNGDVMTNPGWECTETECALGTPDEESQLLIIKREGKPEIGIVNFQVHPDVIGGCLYSADFPGFVRRTYEKLVPNSLCMYLNGTQGDTNHVDIRRPMDVTSHGYERSRYMGEKIAMSVIANYLLAEEISGEKIAFGDKIIKVKFNKGTEEEIPGALKLCALYREKGSESAALPHIEPLMRRVEMVAEACRIEKMMSMPELKELRVSALSVGDMVFAGFPGEPFTDVGRAIKKNSKFTFTMPVCCANGYEGYFPTEQAYAEGGYEVLSASYVGGTAEKLIEASTEIVNSL